MKPTSWAFTSLMNYERCPHSVTFPYRAIDNEFTLRGTELHNQTEQYFIADTPLPFNCDVLIPYRDMCQNTAFQVEPKWGFTADWQPADWQNAAIKIKPDLVIAPSNNNPTTILEFKSGKREGREAKHNQQVNLYSAAAHLVYPGVEVVSVIVYLDHNLKIPSLPMSAPRAEVARSLWKKRGDKMLNDEQYNPNPGKSRCKYCFERDRCEFTYEE